MNILMVNKFLYPRGGAETYMLQIGEYLTQQGHSVEYFGMTDQRNTVGNQVGLYTYNMDFHSRSAARLCYPFKIIYSREAYRKLGQVIDRSRPDVIHMHNINFQLTPAVIDAAWAKGVPVVQTVHDYQMVCPNHLLYNLREEGVCQRCVTGSKWNCAKYGCIHNSRIKSILGSLEAIVYQKRETYRRVARYICPSRFLAEKLNLGSSVFAGKTEVIHNYIELPPTETGPYVSREKAVLFAGRLSLEKGIGILAGAARLLPEIQFLAAGAGPAAGLLSGIPNVRVLGFLDQYALKKLMGQVAAVLVPSIWYENCPLTILEAQAAGTPVITANRGGMAELVEHGKTGILVDQTDAAGFAAEIRRLMGDPKSLAAISENCMREREKMVTLPAYCRRLMGIYQRASEGRTGHHAAESQYHRTGV